MLQSLQGRGIRTALVLFCMAGKYYPPLPPANAIRLPVYQTNCNLSPFKDYGILCSIQYSLNYGFIFFEPSAAVKLSLTILYSSEWKKFCTQNLCHVCLTVILLSTIMNKKALLCKQIEQTENSTKCHSRSFKTYAQLNHEQKLRVKLILQLLASLHCICF